MAGGHIKYRHLSRDSAARQALLRGLVTQLVQFEHIHTTYAKAKEAQRLAEKLITLAKKNNEPCRRHAQGILYTPHLLLPKLFGELRDRYLAREGGYTRVVRTESKNTYDQGESAILEFVDGPKDSRFMMVAKTIARDRLLGQPHTPVTLQNKKKVTNLRPQTELEDMVQRFMVLSTETATDAKTGADAGAGTGAGAGADSESASAEAARLADRESSRVQKMAEGLVPEHVKRDRIQNEAKR